MSRAIELILKERANQISKGYDGAHDDSHTNGELGDFAALYAINPKDRCEYINGLNPFSELDFKPSDDDVENLVKSGALIVSEIERILRLRDRCKVLSKGEVYLEKLNEFKKSLSDGPCNLEVTNVTEVASYVNEYIDFFIRDLLKTSGIEGSLESIKKEFNVNLEIQTLTYGRVIRVVVSRISDRVVVSSKVFEHELKDGNLKFTIFD